MITVTSARRRGARAGRSRRLGARTPRPAIWQASRYFASGLAVGLVALIVAPAVFVAFAGGAGSALAAWLRLAIFGGALWSLWLMLMAIGVAVTGQRMGILWTARNTYSLSRLQITLWTVVVMAALAAVVACRAQGLFLPAGTAGFAGALDIHIPPELLAVLGISLGSAAAAPAILSVKAQADATPRAQVDAAARRVGARMDAIGQVAIRPSDYPPLIEDLFQGDEVAKAGTVDIGKVQQAVVTVILLAAYLGMLAELLFAGSWTAHPGLAAGTTPMPEMSDTFVYLLGISHLGYLAYKAAPATPGTSGAVAVGSGAPAPSTVLPRPQPPSLNQAQAIASASSPGGAP